MDHEIRSTNPPHSSFFETMLVVDGHPSFQILMSLAFHKAATNLQHRQNPSDDLAEDSPVSSCASHHVSALLTTLTNIVVSVFVVSLYSDRRV